MPKFSQTKYVKKILSRFNINNAKSVSTLLGSHFELNKNQNQLLKIEQNHDNMAKVPYVSTISSII
jgi:hypothetical protein